MFIKKKKPQWNDVYRNCKFISKRYSKHHYIINLDQLKIPHEWNSYNNWKINQHVIKSIAEFYNIKNITLKPIMKFGNKEIGYINTVLKVLPKEFIVIEPHSKTINKQYPIEKWQKVVDEISKKIPVIQNSMPGKQVLNNVIDISSKIRSFREAVLILKYAKLFISSEGGLMHGAAAVKCPQVIVFPPIFDPTFTSYENTTAVWIKTDEHQNCYKLNMEEITTEDIKLRSRYKLNECNTCKQILHDHDHTVIISHIMDKLEG